MAGALPCVAAECKRGVDHRTRREYPASTMGHGAATARASTAETAPLTDRWFVRHALAIALPVQAVLLFADLARLPVWGDEQASLSRAALPLAALPAALQHNVHPPLYFALLHGWLAMFSTTTGIVAARALSAVFLLAATVAIDRCWLRALDARSRAWFLMLWTLSPAALLYGRMARSYSLQLLLACLALYAGLRLIERPSPRIWIAFIAGATALLCTHYLSGIAVIGGIAFAAGWNGLRRREWTGVRRIALATAIVAAVLAPSWWHFSSAVQQVAAARPYYVVNRTADAIVALAFTGVSFSVGEALRPWMLMTLAALLPAMAVLIARGVGAAPAWLSAVSATAVIASVGAWQWVSYAFVAARLLFLLPFFLLLLVIGGRSSPRLGPATYAVLAIASYGGIQSYFAKRGFLNKAYVIPSEAIADAIRSGSQGAPMTVIVDHHSTNLSAVAALLSDASITLVTDASSAAAACQLAAQGQQSLVWFVHSTHDSSGEAWNEQIERAFVSRFIIRRTGFAPYSEVDHALMHLAGWAEMPAYAVQLDEMRSSQGS